MRAVAFLGLLLSGPISLLHAQAPVADKQADFDFCQTLDRADYARTKDGASERAKCWTAMKVAGFGDATVAQKFVNAQEDFTNAVKQDSLSQASTAGFVDEKKRRETIDTLILTKRYDEAERKAAEWVSEPGSHVWADNRLEQIHRFQRARAFKNILYVVGAALLVIVVGLVLLARKLGDRHKERSAQRKQAAADRKAMLKVIDGVGRGKLYTLESAVFRIGAASSEKSEERNDLVLSDSAAAISRFHCSVVRREGRFYLIDSSLNGTEVNDELLDRGEDRLLNDGDEVTLANVARLKFLLM